jgi:hypothetical protein
MFWAALSEMSSAQVAGLLRIIVWSTITATAASDHATSDQSQSQSQSQSQISIPSEYFYLPQTKPRRLSVPPSTAAKGTGTTKASAITTTAVVDKSSRDSNKYAVFPSRLPLPLRLLPPTAMALLSPDNAEITVFPATGSISGSGSGGRGGVQGGAGGLSVPRYRKLTLMLAKLTAFIGNTVD